MIKAKQFVLLLYKKKKISKDISSFYFLKPRHFRFFAGQYLQMTVQHDEVDHLGSRRFFTIASAPEEKYVMITTKRTTSSFKKALFGLAPGAEIQCFGPMGKFILDLHLGV